MGADGVGDARAEVLSSPWMLHVILSYLPPAEL